jgi:hypothetical protein
MPTARSLKQRLEETATHSMNWFAGTSRRSSGCAAP